MSQGGVGPPPTVPHRSAISQSPNLSKIPYIRILLGIFTSNSDNTSLDQIEEAANRPGTVTGAVPSVDPRRPVVQTHA
jgi:hypothetical protein